MKDLLLKRLDEIKTELLSRVGVNGFVGLGSIGTELDRLDDYSDLDFFLIVETEDLKYELINNLDWLSNTGTILFDFKNTKDGSKVLFEDGVYCEYAVFTEKEYLDIPYLGERELINKTSIDISSKKQLDEKVLKKEWLIGECLTNLFVGIKRYQRGELFNANKFISRFALDRVIELADEFESSKEYFQDYFDKSRRLEENYTKLSSELNNLDLGSKNALNTASWIISYVERLDYTDQKMVQYLKDEIKKSTR
jgi:hypothetical protein